MGSLGLTVENKTEGKAISSKLLVRFEAKRNALSRIIAASFWTGDKREIHGMAPSSISPAENSNIFRQRTRSWLLSSGNVEWFLWMRHRERRQINSDAYIRTRIKLRNRFKRVRPHNNQTEILLQHGNSRPHASLKNREDVTKFSCKVLFHPPCCPDPAPLDFNLFVAWRI
jgi:hypothetical protein